MPPSLEDAARSEYSPLGYRSADLTGHFVHRPFRPVALPGVLLTMIIVLAITVAAGAWSGSRGSGSPLGEGSVEAAGSAAATSPDSQAADSAVAPSLTGVWHISEAPDGASVGQTSAFQVTLTQDGTDLYGSGAGLTMYASMDGSSVAAIYSRGGRIGTYFWELAPNGRWMTGTFRDAAGGSGTSSAYRLD